MKQVFVLLGRYAAQIGCYRRFNGQAVREEFLDQRVLVETSTTSLRNLLEERRSHLYHGESLRSRRHTQYRAKSTAGYTNLFRSIFVRNHEFSLTLASFNATFTNVIDWVIKSGSLTTE
jgi:hypothetical protein